MMVISFELGTLIDKDLKRLKNHLETYSSLPKKTYPKNVGRILFHFVLGSINFVARRDIHDSIGKAILSYYRK